MVKRSTTYFSVCKEGGDEIALRAMREAIRRGFRVTTNTTIFEGVDSKSVRAFFSEMMDAGVEGVVISPGYSYDKAPDQQHFSNRESNQSMFRRILSNRDSRWRFNMSPLFLEFLMGKRNLHCTPWGCRRTMVLAGRNLAISAGRLRGHFPGIGGLHRVVEIRLRVG